MTDKIYETIIIGAGISGLACAKTLQEKNKEFLIISEDIGGRILTSEDGTANYGAFFVCSAYHHTLKHITLKSRIRLRDFCFHEQDKTYVLFQPKLIRYLFQFLKVIKILYKFRKKLRKLRKTCINISQKKAIEQDPFLHDLYTQNATDFVKKHKIENGTNVYLSKALYSTTFSQVHEMNAFSFLEFLLPLITPIYRFKFEKEKMIEPFKEKIKIDQVINVEYTKDQYKVKTKNSVFYAKNIVLATPISWSKKYVNIKKTNKPVDTNMLHVRGIPKQIVSKRKYQLFSRPSNVQSMADLNNGTFLFYYKKTKPNLENYFEKPQVIAHKHWDPVGTINGHELIECNRGNNMFLIGDYNIAGLEEAYITGVYAANQIIKKG